jgi:hypothetical protein
MLIWFYDVLRICITRFENVGTFAIFIKAGVCVLTSSKISTFVFDVCLFVYVMLAY